jgi:hypothetical protein
MDCMLGEGLDVVRGDVQTRLFGGAEEEVGRLVRFSDVVMIFCRLMDATETTGGDLRLSMKGAGAEQECCTRAGSCKMETPETLKCVQMHVGRDRGREDGCDCGWARLQIVTGVSCGRASTNALEIIR